MCVLRNYTELYISLSRMMFTTRNFDIKYILSHIYAYHALRDNIYKRQPCTFKRGRMCFMVFAWYSAVLVTLYMTTTSRSCLEGHLYVC